MNEEALAKVKALCEALAQQTMNYLMTGNKKDNSWRTDGKGIR